MKHTSRSVISLLTGERDNISLWDDTKKHKDTDRQFRSPNGKSPDNPREYDLDYPETQKETEFEDDSEDFEHICKEDEVLNYWMDNDYQPSKTEGNHDPLDFKREISQDDKKLSEYREDRKCIN